MSFNGKTVWITGASSGIGAACAREWAGRGASVILSGRRTDALEQVRGELSGEHHVLAFEATDYDALPAMVERAVAFTGRVDILVNNAGISQRSLAEHTEPDVYHTIVNIDLLAPIRLTQLLLPSMIAARGGHVVAISSVAGRAGVPLRTGYCAAKHGLIGYMDALRTEVERRHGIGVTNILPGSIATDVSRNALTKDGGRRGKSDAVIDNGMDPADCARRIVDAVAAGKRDVLIADGMEASLSQMRHDDPEALFDLTAKLGERIANDYAAGKDE